MDNNKTYINDLDLEGVDYIANGGKFNNDLSASEKEELKKRNQELEEIAEKEAKSNSGFAI